MKKKLIPIGIVGYFLVMIALIGVLGWYWQNFQKTPQQPIEFPHNVHVGKLKLDCQFCHQFASKSRFATVPTVKLCVDCHKTAATDRPEVKKLMKYWEDQIPIEWLKVYSFRKNANVNFSHKPHIRAGVDCSTCHGRVDQMITARKTRNINMGFCVSCHRQAKAPTDCWTCHK